MVYPSNIHPADELHAVRTQIKALQERESALRDTLLAANDDGRDGDTYRAFVLPSTRETLDKKALTAALGIDVVAPFLKLTMVKTVKLAKKEEVA